MFTVINEKNRSRENWLTFLPKVFCQKKPTQNPNKHPAEEMAKPNFPPPPEVIFLDFVFLDFVFNED